MTDATETALEEICGGILFCIAVTIALLLHRTYAAGMAGLRASQQKMIVYEEDGGWRHLED